MSAIDKIELCETQCWRWLHRTSRVAPGVRMDIAGRLWAVTHNALNALFDAVQLSIEEREK